MQRVHKLIESKCKQEQKLFLQAIYQNMLKDNSRLLAKWNLHQYYYDTGTTYLSTAAKIGDFLTINKLLDDGADIELTDLYGRSPLACAIIYGHNKIVKLICDKMTKKLINPKDVLQCAVANGNADATKILLKKWPSIINQKDLKMATALHIAINQGSHKCVSKLIKYGVDFREPCPAGNTPLQLAVNIRNNISLINEKIIKCAELIIGMILGYESAINCQTHNSYGFCQSDMELLKSDITLYKYYLECCSDSEELYVKFPFQSETIKLFLENQC